VGTLALACSMAEIASIYPTAGGKLRNSSANGVSLL
jgi:amino acid transporter